MFMNIDGISVIFIDFLIREVFQKVLNSWYEVSSTYYGRMEATSHLGSIILSFTADLNAGNTNITKSNAARSAANHELGHVLGLDHVSGTSIMNSNRNRQTIYVPQTDDINGVNAIYN